MLKGFVSSIKSLIQSLLKRAEAASNQGSEKRDDNESLITNSSIIVANAITNCPASVKLYWKLLSDRLRKATQKHVFN